MENKFEPLKKQIRLNKYIYSKFLGKKKMIMKYYKQMQGYSYDFNNPVLFTEKINSRKLDKNPLFPLCADKIRVRDYVKEKIGSKYLIPCYFTSKKMTNNLFDNMPRRCVLKTAGGSGTIKVIYDKNKENKKEVVKLLNDFLKVDFSFVWGEMFYKKIPKGIICEKLLLDKDGNVPSDYKFHCFNDNGNFKCFLQIEFDRFGTHTRNIYDENFNLLDVTTGLPNNPNRVKKPKKFNEMIKISKKLSEDFDYVRVDLYNVDGRIYFGELTFTHNAGFSKFVPQEYNEIWGSYWK